MPPPKRLDADAWVTHSSYLSAQTRFKPRTKQAGKDLYPAPGKRLSWKLRLPGPMFCLPLTGRAPVLPAFNPRVEEKLRGSAFGRTTAAAAAQDMVDGNRTTSKKDQGKGEGEDGEGKFKARAVGCADQAVVPMSFPDSDEHINGNGAGGDSGEEPGQDEQSAQEFGERRNVAEPVREAKRMDEINVVVQPAEDIVISVHDHDCANCQAHDEQAEGLQAVEVAQGFSSGTIKTGTIKIRVTQPVAGGAEESN